MKYKHDLTMKISIQDGLLYRYWFYFYPAFIDKRNGREDRELGKKIIREYYHHIPHGWSVESVEDLILGTGMGGLKIGLKDFNIQEHLDTALKSADDIQAFYDDIFDKALMAKLVASGK